MAHASEGKGGGLQGVNGRLVIVDGLQERGVGEQCLNPGQERRFVERDAEGGTARDRDCDFVRRPGRRGRLNLCLQGQHSFLRLFLFVFFPFHQSTCNGLYCH